jgi:hypothetical protein
LNLEQTDEEIAATIDAEDELLGQISEDDWMLICKHDLRGELLEALRLGSWSVLDELLMPFRSGVA